jgi:hypothetical protein
VFEDDEFLVGILTGYEVTQIGFRGQAIKIGLKEGNSIP